MKKLLLVLVIMSHIGSIILCSQKMLNRDSYQITVEIIGADFKYRRELRILDKLCNNNKDCIKMYNQRVRKRRAKFSEAPTKIKYDHDVHTFIRMLQECYFRYDEFNFDFAQGYLSA